MTQPDLTSLRRKVGNASAWMVVASAGQQIVGFLVFLFLARTLAPVDFGNMALALIFIDLAGFLGRVGTVEILQREETLDDLTASSVFWFLQAVAIVLIILLVIAAHPLAIFFGSPPLENLLIALSPVFWLFAVSGLHEAFLKRTFQFRAFAVRTVLASLGGGLVAVVLAASGCGVYALVGQRLSTLVFAAIIVWCSYRWYPKVVFSPERAWCVARQGFSVAASGTIGILAPKTTDFLVGHLLGPAALGQIRIAYRLCDLFLQVFASPVIGVSVNAYARVREAGGAIGRALDRFHSLIILVMAPALIGATLVASDLIPFAFGEKWRSVAPLFGIAAISTLLLPIQLLANQALVALGLGHRLLQIAAFQILIAIALVTVAAQIDIWAVLLADVVRNGIIGVLTVWALPVSDRTSLFGLARSIAPVFAACCAIAVAIIGLGCLVQAESSLVRLVSSVAVALAVFPLTILVGDRCRLWPGYVDDLWWIGRESLRRRATSLS